MAVTKNSERTVKCNRCGRRDFYWYHDNLGGQVTCEQDRHDDCRKVLLVKKDDDTVAKRNGEGGYIRHDNKCRDKAWHPFQAEQQDNGNSNGKADDKAAEQAVKQAKEANDKASQLAEALLDLASDSLDEDRVVELIRKHGTVLSEKDIQALVDDAVLEVSLPTRVTINDVEKDKEYDLPDVTHQVLPAVIRVLDAADDHEQLPIWLVGPAGTGKSTIAKQAAEALDLPFGAISLSPNTSVSELVGYNDANGTYQRTVFRERFEHGGVFLFDEIDNAHPSTLAKVNMALANGQMAFPDGMVKRHPDFRGIAAANTYGTGPDRQYVGRLKIDAATLDRFVQIKVDVDEALETTIAHAQGADKDATDKLLRYVRHLRAKADEHNLPIMFSPRASIQGARLLAQGFSWGDVVDMRVRKGVSDADWAKVNQGWKE